MASISVNRMTNANVYNAGNSLLGKVEEVTLPAIKSLVVEHKALGMAMAIDLPTGFEKMTGTMKWNAVYSDLIKEFGSPYATKQIQVRGNLETWDSSGRASQSAVVAYMTIRFKDVLPPIGMKQNDNPEMQSEFSCSYYKLEVDGEKLIEFDAFTNMFFVGNNDELQQYRSNLGL